MISILCSILLMILASVIVMQHEVIAHVCCYLFEWLKYSYLRNCNSTKP